jgi:hypothetical protein
MASGIAWNCLLGSGHDLRPEISKFMTDHQKEAFLGFLFILISSLLLGLLIQFL